MSSAINIFCGYKYIYFSPPPDVHFNYRMQVCSLIYDVVQRENVSSSVVYKYFQMLYNVTALFNVSWVVSRDGGASTFPVWYGELRRQLQNCGERSNLLANMCYIAHAGFLGQSNYRQRFAVYGIKDVNILPFISERLYEYGRTFMDASKEDSGASAKDGGASGEYGMVAVEYGSEVARMVATGSDVSSDTAIKQLLAEYEDLTTHKKTVCAFFENADPVVFWLMMACTLIQKYSVDAENAILLCFALATFIRHADMFYRTFRSSYAEDTRPYHFIRHTMPDTMVTSWTPYGTRLIRGAEWLPYQDISLSPSHYPCIVTRWGLLSVVACNLFQKWFGNEGELYDGFRVVSVPSGAYFSKAMSICTRRLLCGEFVVSQSEPVYLRYERLDDLLKDILRSGIYGGINTVIHAENSRRVGDTVYRLLRDGFTRILKHGFPAL